MINELSNKINNEINNKTNNEISNKMINETNNKMNNKTNNEMINELSNKINNEIINEINNKTNNEISNKMIKEMNKIKEAKIQKPFLKWIGGKTKIMNTIIEKFPKEINNYHEVFLGGGSILLALLSLQKQKKIIIKNKIYAYDINQNLINVYKNLQSYRDELYKYTELYMSEYDSMKGNIINRNPLTVEESKTSKESYYYWIRKKYNTIDKNSIECSALFMFLNKTCFRGMYREGPNGFNVPYGHYKKTPIINTKKEFYYISDLIKNVIFIQSDFNDSIKKIGKEDFVYLDPPYAPKNKISFVGYVSDGFNLEKHNKLFYEIKELSKKNIKFIMSNSKVELVVDNFKNYKCEDIITRHSINAKKPGSKTTELIIYN
jgi:DNA adenine methylase